MAKQPYIPFYLGDYLKDTRILPLNVRGGWVDLILYMWDNKVRGELVGTYDDFARLMTCSKEEAILVIQTLNQKSIFDYAELPDGKMRIESRKMKNMEKLSKTRKTAGLKGGNPILLNQKDNLNTEYEYKNEVNNGNSFFLINKTKVYLKPSDWIKENKESAVDAYMSKNANGISAKEVYCQLDSEYTNYSFDDHNHVFNAFKVTHKKILHPHKNSFAKTAEPPKYKELK